VDNIINAIEVEIVRAMCNKDVSGVLLSALHSGKDEREFGEACVRWMWMGI
jgi:hypothetical protein